MFRSSLLEMLSLILKHHAKKAYMEREGEVLRTHEFIWQRLGGPQSQEGK